MEPFLRRHLLLSLLLAMVFVAAGCQTKEPAFTPHVARLYIEESQHMPASHITDMVLPISRSAITVRARPVFAEWDIATAGYFETEFGPALILLFSSHASADFYRTTITNLGRRLVITINGIPVGAHYIDRPIEDGRVLFFLEIPDEDVPEVADSIRRTSAEIQKRANQRGRW